jgi:Cysteine rich repeat
MSALTLKMSALPLKADMCGAARDVRFWPEADIGPKGNYPGLKNTKGSSTQAVPKEQKFLWLNRSSEETRYHMFIRQLTAASLVAFALISLPGSTRTATAQALKYCKEDVARLCPGVAPGGGKIIACLKQHENEVSIGCGKELKAIKAKMGK